jgi:NAD(P)H-dependent FMN reductase
MRAEAGVDVVSDNASEISVWPPTTSPQHRKATQLACRQEQRQGRPVVCDNVDTLSRRPHDRVMEQTDRYRNYQGGKQSTRQVAMTGASARRRCVTSTRVLVIPGISTSVVSHGLADAAALGSPNGITLNVFDSLDYLPCYRETLENQRLPRLVAALRDAAIEAHAAIVLTHYYGQIPAMVHNAIDWLTLRWNHSALHDKPLAIIGPTEGGYSGIWSRHQTEESGRIAETLVIEPISVTTLHEAVAKLAEQANITRAIRADRRYEPGLVTEPTPEMKLRGGFRAADADESEVHRLRHELAKAKAQLEELEQDADTA